MTMKIGMKTMAMASILAVAFMSGAMAQPETDTTNTHHQEFGKTMPGGGQGMMQGQGMMGGKGMMMQGC